jgi:hypothetical protein
MIRHVVMMKLIAATTDADKSAMVEALGELPGLVPEIRSYSIGVDAGLGEGNFDLVVIGDFDDANGYAAYASNADHQRVVVEYLRPALAERVAIQYELGD